MKNKNYVIAGLWLLFFSSELLAETSRQAREEHRLGANFNLAPMSIPFPWGWGFNANFYPSADWSIGFDYLTSTWALKLFSIELGEIQEKTYTLQARRYFGNSFNLKMGIGQRETAARLPLDLFEFATKDYSLLVSEMQTKFVTVGLGNQWQFGRRYTFVMDWFSLNVPYSGEIVQSVSDYVDDENDKKSIREKEDFLKFYPSGAIFKMEFGVMF